MSEGGRALITSEHLKVVVDYSFYGIPESGVLFHVAESPSKGRLDVNVWDRKEDNIFTLLDLNTDQVSIHEFYRSEREGQCTMCNFEDKNYKKDASTKGLIIIYMVGVFS